MTLFFHVLAGALGLITGFVALSVSKGGDRHRVSGRIFVSAMLAMAVSGAAIAAFQGVAPAINIPAAMVTAYLVITAFTTVRPRTDAMCLLDRAAMRVAFVTAGVCLISGIVTLTRGGRGSGMAYPLFLFGAVAFFAARGDVRMLRLDALEPASRLRRHLWRMCAALFIAAGSFFLGQADEVPAALRIPALLAVPAFAPLLAMLYWLRRVRRHNGLGHGHLQLDEDDFQEEVRAHLAMAAADRIADGVDPVTARQASLKEFGNVTLATEAARRIWTPRWLASLHDACSDVRYAIRSLAKNPGFSLTVIGVLTIGIGLNAAVFTMLKSIALTPIAGVARSAQLHAVYGESAAGRDIRLSYPDYVYLRDHHASFSSLLGYRLGTLTLGRGRHARQISSELVTGNYFQVLGVRAQLGRTFLPSDELAPGRHPVVVLSDRLWRNDFQSDPAIVGTTIELNNQTMTVVGVTEASFHGTIVSYDVEAFVPVMMAPQLGFTFGLPSDTPQDAVLSDRRADMLYAMGHLRPGETLAGATGQADTIWAELTRHRAAGDVLARLRVVPFWQVPGTAQSIMLPLLVVLTVMGLLVLMIACANVAGLVVVRGVSRRGEVALRLALGATRARIVRLLVIENLVLALPGAVLGVALTGPAVSMLVGNAEALAAPQRLFFNSEIDAMVIGFSVLIACGSALVFGFVPALRCSRLDLVSVLKDEAPRGSVKGRLRSSLVVAQVAVSLVLLVGAGLVSGSLDAARRADRGFQVEGVTAVALDLKANAYDEARGRDFYRRLLEHARATPGVEAATLAQYTPLSFLDTRQSPVVIEGYPIGQGEDLSFLSNTVAADYFRTLRVPVVAGREFDERDTEAAAPVVVVNQTLAERFWGSAEQAIGKRLQIADDAWRTVVGVAADLKYARVNEGPRPYVYVPSMQEYRAVMILHTRGTAPIETLVEQARASVGALDADLPVLSAGSLERETRGALIFFQLLAVMLFIFGLAGMALAALGTYGLVSYSVRQGTLEIGIRMALGASRLSVVRGFLTRGVRLGAIGAVLGAVGAYTVSGLLAGVLFGVSTTDPISFARALGVVLSGVVLATVFPAWRASRTNPMVALRHR